MYSSEIDDILKKEKLLFAVTLVFQNSRKLFPDLSGKV